jgi:hypothetical protein
MSDDLADMRHEDDDYNERGGLWAAQPARTDDEQRILEEDDEQEGWDPWTMDE